MIPSVLVVARFERIVMSLRCPLFHNLFPSLSRVMVGGSSAARRSASARANNLTERLLLVPTASPFDTVVAGGYFNPAALALVLFRARFCLLTTASAG